MRRRRNADEGERRMERAAAGGDLEAQARHEVALIRRGIPPAELEHANRWVQTSGPADPWEVPVPSGTGVPRRSHECERPDVTTCGNCDRSWCDHCDPSPGPLCPFCHGRGYSDAEVGVGDDALGAFRSDYEFTLARHQPGSPYVDVWIVQRTGWPTLRQVSTERLQLYRIPEAGGTVDRWIVPGQSRQTPGTPYNARTPAYSYALRVPFRARHVGCRVESLSLVNDQLMARLRLDGAWAYDPTVRGWAVANFTTAGLLHRAASAAIHGQCEDHVGWFYGWSRDVLPFTGDREEWTVQANEALWLRHRRSEADPGVLWREADDEIAQLADYLGEAIGPPVLPRWLEEEEEEEAGLLDDEPLYPPGDDYGHGYDAPGDWIGD